MLLSHWPTDPVVIVVTCRLETVIGSFICFCHTDLLTQLLVLLPVDWRQWSGRSYPSVTLTYWPTDLLTQLLLLLPVDWRQWSGRSYASLLRHATAGSLETLHTYCHTHGRHTRSCDDSEPDTRHIYIKWLTYWPTNLLTYWPSSYCCCWHQSVWHGN